MIYINVVFSKISVLGQENNESEESFSYLTHKTEFPKQNISRTSFQKITARKKVNFLQDVCRVNFLRTFLFVEIKLIIQPRFEKESKLLCASRFSQKILITTFS